MTAQYAHFIILVGTRFERNREKKNRSRRRNKNKNIQPQRNINKSLKLMSEITLIEIDSEIKKIKKDESPFHYTDLFIKIHRWHGCIGCSLDQRRQIYRCQMIFVRFDLIHCFSS